MMLTRNKIIHKLKSKKGMSIGELLVATLILLMVTSVMVTGIQLAQEHFLRSLRQSEAQELYSTLEMALYNDLSYVGKEDSFIECDDSGEVKSYRSSTYSMQDSQNIKLTILDKNGSETSEYGEIVAASSTDDDLSSYNRIVSSSLYPNGLGVRIDSFTYDKDKKEFTLEISIAANQTKLFDKTLSVRAINR